MMKGKQTDEGRRKVTQAAFKLFAQKGYVQTSVDSIAEKAKVSKGLIYYYFKSKEEILKAVFNSLIHQSGLVGVGDEKLSPQEYLKKQVEQSFYLITGKTKLFRLLLALATQPEVTKSLKVELERVRRQLMAEMAKAFKALGYENPQMEVYQLCALFDGVGIAYLTLKDYPVKGVQQFIEKKYKL